MIRRAAFFCDLGTAIFSPSSLVQAEFEAWRRLYGSESEGLFERRLNTFREERFSQKLDEPGDGRWADRWASAVAYLEKGEKISAPDPFSDLWSPLVNFARSEFQSSVPFWVRETAISRLCHGFLHELCQVAAPAVYELFNQARSEGQSYEVFVKGIREARYLPVIEQFPALARGIGTMLDQWIENVENLFTRLQNDFGEIRSRIVVIEKDECLHDIASGWSDRHDGGCQTMSLEFESGRKILYKTKEMSVEARLPEVNRWFERERIPVHLRFPRSVEKEGYGWSEFVEHQPCRSIEEVRQFFRNAGHLLCLAHLLGATDLLYENLIASGSSPVIIDLESFFYPEIRNFSRSGSRPSDLTAQPSARSVVDTGLLTLHRASASHANCDLSALSGFGGQIHTTQKLVWLDVNSNHMRPAFEQVKTKSAKNQVYLNGELQHPSEFVEEVVAGFDELHQAIEVRKRSFSDFIATFSDARTRLIFRPSQVYALLIKRSLEPANLQSGFLRNVALDQIYRPPLRGHYLTPELAEIIDHEVSSMLRLDIPRFYLPIGAIDPNHPLSKIAIETPLNLVRQFVDESSSASRNTQIEIIRESLTRRSLEFSRPWSSGAFSSAAFLQLKKIRERISAFEEPYVWRKPVFLKEDPSPAERAGIYQGDLGCLIALAAADYATGEANSSELQERVANQWLKSEVPVSHGSLGIGQGIGAGIYSSVLLYQLTTQRSWLGVALEIASRVSETAIRECHESDLLSGLSGLLLALTRLHQVAPDDAVARKAQLIVAELGGRYRSDLGWPRPSGEAALGLAHGSAGVGFAMASFAKQTQDERAKEWAERAIAFDRKFYLPSEKNWPVLVGQKTSALSAWCAGAPGILLARVAVAEIVDSSLLREEIERGLEDFPAESGLDFWCCGSLGLAEILSSIATSLNRPDLETKARGIAESIFERAFRLCYFRFSRHLGENFCFQPSLFRGLAGATYSALRLGVHKKLPSIVAFQLLRPERR